MPTIGKDCDITLTHPDVNGGNPVGFLLYNLAPAQRQAGKAYGPSVKIHYESYNQATGQIQDVRHLWFTVLIADQALNPDGSPHAQTAAVARAHLINILMQHSQITLTTPAGSIAGLYSNDHVMIQNIFPYFDTVEVHLTTRSAHFAPVDPTLYFNSLWAAEDYTGIMTWDNSYWR